MPPRACACSTSSREVRRPYLEAVQLELELLLLIEELLQPIREDYVRIVEAAVFLVELVILVSFWLLFRGGIRRRGAQLVD